MRGLRTILARPLLWAVARFSSKPNRKRIFEALTMLSVSILKHPGKRGLVIPFEEHAGKFIIFSDQHKGNRNGADDFKNAETNYLSALNYYSSNDFCFINLGDSEELWENSIWKVKKKNKATFEAEKKFLDHNKYIKIFGNHDLYWNTGLWAYWHLKSMYGEKVKVYEGVILKSLVGSSESGVNTSDSVFRADHSITGKRRINTQDSELRTNDSELTIFLTHGHQGDAQSDGNRFSKFFVQYVWAPLQSLLRINPNTPSNNNEKKTLHNTMMYEWSKKQKDLLLVTGHTHQPVFASLTHLEKLYKEFQLAGQGNNKERTTALLDEIKKREKDFSAVSVDYMDMKPSYFNTGCCCFSDGDITGIEIAGGYLRLIKWTPVNGQPVRILLEEDSLENIRRQL